MTDAAQVTKPGADEAPIEVNLFGLTDVGQIREHNEDNFLLADLARASRIVTNETAQAFNTHGTVLGVCDGMGGAAAGEVASQLAVDIIFDCLTDGEPPRNHEQLATRLVRAVEQAGLRIFADARADRSRRGMGTTATVAALLDARLFVAQVGDSRAYVFREGHLIQITRDQSLVNQLIEAGQLTEEEAENFEHNNIILQALGTADTVQVDLTYADLCQGDVLLLCSDGLSGMLRAEEIRDVLSNAPDPADASRQLTHRANLAGGHDNITVIVSRFSGAGLPAPGAAATPAYRKYPLAEATEPPAGETTGEAERPTDIASIRPPSGAESERPPEPPQAAASAPEQSDSTASQQAAPVSVRHQYRTEDDPVHIPTTGLPPSLVGLIVLAALLFVAATGFILLR